MTYHRGVWYTYSKGSEYEGKLYGFCCPACIEEFKKDPEKYISKMGAQSKGGEGMHEGHEH